MDLLHNFVRYCFFHIFTRCNGNFFKTLDADFTLQLLLQNIFLVLNQCEAEQTKFEANSTVFIDIFEFLTFISAFIIP